MPVEGPCDATGELRPPHSSIPGRARPVSNVRPEGRTALDNPPWGPHLVPLTGARPHTRTIRMKKREFVRAMGGASLALLLGEDAWARYAALPPQRLALDEAFWGALRRRYRLTTDYINLKNGYYSMQSEPVLEAFIGRVREVNLRASYYMRTRQFDDKAAVRDRLAVLAGVPPEELIVTRNTTESLDTVIG